MNHIKRYLSLLITLFFLLAISTTAQENQTKVTFQFQPGQSVYVIAGKSRAQLNKEYFEKLTGRKAMNGPAVPGESLGSDRRPTIDRTEPERTTLERAEPNRRVLPEPDARLKQQIEEEILKQKQFKLADSPENADFIFFINGEYIYSDTWRTPSGGGGRFGAGPPDSAIGNTLAKITMAAIPASSYQKWHSHYSKLFEISVWQGEAWGKAGFSIATPDTPKAIQQFHKATLKK